MPDTGSLPDAALAGDAARLGWPLHAGQLPDVADLSSWPYWIDLAWVLLWLLGLAGIVIFERWEAIPFHQIWISSRADRERLGLAVDALLENAIQHTVPGDMIRLSVIRDGLARLVVADGGSGIAPAELAYIFDRFATGTASDGRRGTGLGLSLVRAVARGHGGDVHVYRTVGSGSTFVICLPSLPADSMAGHTCGLASDPCGSLGAR